MLHPPSSIRAFMLHGNLTFDVQNMKYPLGSILDITINYDNRTQLNQNYQEHENTWAALLLDLQKMTVHKKLVPRDRSLRFERICDRVVPTW